MRESLKSRGIGEETGAPCLVARDVWFSYDGQSHVLKGINMTASQGIMTMILGRSGSGKTTLLKMLKGLLSPQKGLVEIRLESETAGAVGAIAYVPQNLGLVRNLTALENVLIGALAEVGWLRSLTGAYPKKVREEAEQTLRELGLGHKAEEKVYNLSGGERQRVAIGRALMLKPELIVADEFVSQLDPVTTREMFVLMRKLTRQGVGFIITTHETDLVADYADRVLIMKEGSIIYEGDGTSLTEAEMIELLG